MHDVKQIIERKKNEKYYNQFAFFVKAARNDSYYLPLKTLPGNRIIPFNNSKAPSTAIPNIRKGSVSSQKMGYNTRARIASGQQKIKSIIQIRKLSIEGN